MRPVVAFEVRARSLWRPVIRDGRLVMDEHAAIALDGNADESPPPDARRSRRWRAPPATGGVTLTVALPARAVLRKRSCCRSRWRRTCAR